MGVVRILIADDHSLIRSGLRSLRSHEPGFEVIAEAADGREAVEVAERRMPNVAILDIGMPVLNGIQAARQITESLRDVQIVILTVHADECYLVNALKAGARGYVLKARASIPESPVVTHHQHIFQKLKSGCEPPVRRKACFHPMNGRLSWSLILIVAGAAYIGAALIANLDIPLLGAAIVVLAARELGRDRRHRRTRTEAPAESALECRYPRQFDARQEFQ